MPSIQELEQAMIAADKAGDTQGAQILANEISNVSQSNTKSVKPSNYAAVDVPLTALSNAPSDLGDVLSNLYTAARHPANSMQGAIQLASGGLSKILPESIMKYAIPEKRQQAEAVANAVGQDMSNKYGGYENIKRTLAEHPVSAALDLSTILGGGGALLKGAGEAGQINALSKVGNVLNTASTYTNPLAGVVKAIEVGALAIGKGVSHLVDFAGTHTGAEPIIQAAKTGLESPLNFMQQLKTLRTTAPQDFAAAQEAAQNAPLSSKQILLQNMKGEVPFTDVLDEVKSNIDAMGKAKQAQYRSGMADVSKDKTILDFKGIDESLSKAEDVVKFKGVVKNQTAKATIDEIRDAVNKWKKLDPAEYHTPEGLDALKQNIGSIVEKIPFTDRTSLGVGTTLYKSIKKTIETQAPSYSKVMKDYADSSELITEINRALIGGKKASADTSLRKLQSIMRNNVNTNYGNRLALAKTMQEQGGKNIMPALAGQSLSSWTPRGLASAGVGAIEGLIAGSTMGLPAGLGALAIQSPRLVGNAALKTGELSKIIQQLLGKKPIQQAAPYMYQAGQIPQEQGLLGQ